jgi:cytochrome o ubiquinol oxidase subunit 2
MSELNKNRRKSHAIWFMPIFVVVFVSVITRLLQHKNIALFNPKGSIASQEHQVMTFTLVLLLLVAIPSLALLYFITWKYRDTNVKAKPTNQVKHGKKLVALIWLFPTAIMLLLVSVMWPITHALAPQKTITADAKPLTIQVISLRWKWLFIYPDQQIASLNYVQLPVHTPVTFEMTADETPMSSFWIPNLGGQLYTMTSHVNRLNLMANVPGDYPGSSAEINGTGFAGMKFTARASSQADFDQWVQDTKHMPGVLDYQKYQQLLKPSEYNKAEYYSAIEPNIYANVIQKYEGPGGHTH